MRFLYNLSLRLIYLAIHVIAPFNKKMKKWVKGQKIPYPHVNPNYPVIWLHSPSYGEFEQAEPVIKKLKNEFPGHKLLVTFFSPSGFEGKKNHSDIDYCVYLPFDFVGNVKAFLDHFNPTIALFVKYDFWFNYIHELDKRSIPSIYFSCAFRPDQYFFRFRKFWVLNQLKKVSHFFVQNDASKDLLEAYGIHQVSLSGDTRIEQVLINAKNKFSDPLLESFCDGQEKIIVLGSTWNEDIDIWTPFLNKSDYKFIIAPHEINEKNLLYIENKCQSVRRYSKGEHSNKQVLIIDTLGLLKYIYRYADVCYVGGGFGKGIHNTLEAAVYRKPLVFGPKYQKFHEAQALIDLGAAKTISNSLELQNLLQRYTAANNATISDSVNNYFKNQQGATDLIVAKVKELL